MDRRRRGVSEWLRTRRGRLQTCSPSGWRDWNQYRSKLVAWLHASKREWPLEPDASVLYLGAAEGTTVSHVCDLCPRGRVTAIEVSPTAMAELLIVAKRYQNLLPVLTDAHFPARYQPQAEGCDFLYQDIAQRDQLAIFLRNWDFYQPRQGLLILKAPGIDTRTPEAVLDKAESELCKTFATVERSDISRWAKGHAAFWIEEPLGEHGATGEN
ncbi:MAG: fibrillarin-like rRNA/tRNA 2'-O-methyltransferase [Candidatus Thermoplasmatota archaeon]|nr:fibrillarin-like rRNA/tRNA 2'-O-methyltransferase [Candidatus Thermoplasmatota archaeon]